MILLQRAYSNIFEERLFRNKANRDATRRWQMQEGGKNRIVITDKGQQQLQEAYNTSIGKGAGKGYAYGQASGPNGTRTLAERQSELLQEGRLANRPGGDSLANKGDMTDRTRNLSEKRQRELAERRNARTKPKQSQPQQPTAPAKPAAPTSAPKPQPNPSTTAKTGQKGGNLISNNMQRVKRLYTGNSKYGKAGQAAAIGITALAAGALGYGAYKAIKNKKQQQQQKSFSTGNEELDLILQEVYYSGLEDGYDYAQREFSYDDDDDDDDFPRKPKDLEDYSDYDLKHMTRGQMLDALEEEQERAKRNTKKYVKHHGEHEAKKGAERGEKRGKKAGTITGSILGGLGAGLALGSSKGPKAGLAGAAGGALVGGLLGRVIGKSSGRDSGEIEGRKKGQTRGLRYAKEDLHDSDTRAKKLARRMDDEARRKGEDADFESRIQGGIDKREEAKREAARRAAELAEKRRQEAREDRIRREKMRWEDTHRAQDREDAREARERASMSGGYTYNESRNNVRIDRNNFDW